ncbi:apolipoprotein N-acyltransferase [Acinetobacter nectaris]|uniref:apolipoprotein N-acyltransferase n=1 Tax=Acinetobacter nectaris TaxID=1219382 RepID=UPI001F016A60|nr:apolipoprotein N-acyltransferase [Acinetobacter nectaris]MCF9033473.1 apolipoprotein N-acyltransferase [Acinetobacter nectaris]
MSQVTSTARKTFKLPTFVICIIALISGGIFSLSLAPYHYWWIALLSPALLYACLIQCKPRQAFLIGWSFGFGLWFTGAFWLFASIHNYGNISTPIGVLLIALLAMTMGLFSAVQTWTYKRFFPETPLTFAPIWILFEWLKTWLFTGFPWLFVGYAFTGAFLDDYAPLFGVLSVSFVAVLIATACVEIIRKRIFWILPIFTLLIGAWGASYLQFVQPKNERPLSVSLVQGNIPQDLKWLSTYQDRTLEIYQNLSATEWGRDLIVWPESAIPMTQTAVAPFIEEIAQTAKTHHSAWLSGIPYYDENASIHAGKSIFYNSLMALGDQTSGLYEKQRLVPFGEYVPFAGLLKWVLPALQDDITEGSLSAGPSGQKALNVKQHDLGTAICYEVAYPNLTRTNAQHSDFMVTISNDAWFSGTAGPWQHLQMVQMRAKENGRWFIRATNTGVTAFINEKGQIVSQAPIDRAFVLRHDLPAFSGQTLYNRLGDLPILIFSVLLLGLGIYYRPKQIDVSFKSRR